MSYIYKWVEGHPLVFNTKKVLALSECLSEMRLIIGLDQAQEAVSVLWELLVLRLTQH